MFKFQPSFVVFVLFVLYYFFCVGGRGFFFYSFFICELVFSLFLLLALFLAFTIFCEPLVNFLKTLYLQ